MKLALGTVQFGLPYGVANRSGQVGREAGAEILRIAREAGMDTLDTAIAYGESETALGRLGMDGWKVVTKLPGIPEGCPDVPAWVTGQVEASLARLGIDRLHGLLLHRPEQLLGPQGPDLARALLEIRERGKTERVGVSIYDPSHLALLGRVLPMELVQAPLNLLDRRLILSGWLDRLKDVGAEVHVRSAFLQGLLLMPTPERPAFFRTWDPLWEAWDAWLQETRTSALEACLGYPLSLPGIDRVVVGVDAPAQLKALLGTRTRPFCGVPPFPEAPAMELINPSLWSTP